MFTITNETSLAESIRLLAVKTRGLREDPRQTRLLLSSRSQLRDVEAGERDES